MPIDFSVDEVRLTTPPLGVIEILSPTQSLQELTTKIGQYFAKGVQSCWLVLPTLKSIYVYQDSQTFQPYTAQDILIDKQLNIELTLAAIFQG
jgi:Uma2 family endonuclease